MSVLQASGNRVSKVTFPQVDGSVGTSDPDKPSGVRWNGEVAAVYVRNSTPVQRGNNRSHWQLDLASYLLGMGYAVKIYNEQGVSGARLTGRHVAAQMIADIKAGAVTCLAVAELSRLTRDDRGFDARYLRECLVEHARGKLITYEKVYDLRRIEDWNEYERLVTAAAWQARELTRALASGLAKGFECGPVFRGLCGLGYVRVPIYNADGLVEVDRYRKVRTVIEKDLRVAAVMTELARQFDVQPDLTSVCRAMNRGGWEAPWRPIVGGYKWRSARLRSILGDSLYEGVWRFSSGGAGNSFWAQFARKPATDDVGFNPAVAEHRVPELAWYSPAQMTGWRGKFLGKSPLFVRGVHIHQFAGLVACAGCHQLLVRYGKLGYRCRTERQRCARGLTVTEKTELAGD
ncbi:MAG TPA: recombinase family protein [Chloroflexota bacterium]|nr:recombinase family protein [Chloroflexota bacterium]